MLVADVHAHIFPDKLAEKVADNLGGFYNTTTAHVPFLHTLLEEEAAAGISVVAGCSSATKASQVEHLNDFIADCAAQNPNFVALGSLYPTMDGWEPELERMQELGIRGIKIHPEFQRVDIDEPKAIPMYRAIAKAGLPVLFHMGDATLEYSTPERLTNLIRQVPDLIAIAAHFGGWQAWGRAYAHVLPENVWYDTSSSLMFLGRERGQDFLEKMGPERFLFGTDFPMWSPKVELARFLELDLDEGTRDRILYGNFAKLFLKQEE